MYTTSEFERLKDDLNIELKKANTILKKLWGILFLVVVILIVVFLLLFPNQFKNSETAWILPVYGGIFLLVTLVGYIVSYSYISEKPFFSFLFPKIIEKLNFDEGLFLEYQSFTKTEKDFNKVGGLFTRIASVKVRRHIKGYTENQHQFDIYDCTLSTSNGKSQTVHFDGVYYRLKKEFRTSIQIRTNGSPKLKGVKFKKQDQFENMKVYKLENDSITNRDTTLINYFEKLKRNENHKRIYIGTIDDELHIATSFKKHPCRKNKTITIDTFNTYLNRFLDEYKIVQELEDLGSY